MAMERLRAQLMQQDPFGVYRTTGNPATNGNVLGSTNNQTPVTTTGFSTTEASAADHYGHPDGYPVGEIFASRKACNDAKVHRAPVKGIAGGGLEGAYSVVVSDGYEDDVDEGDVIWYTGAGGQNNGYGGSEPQKTDQSFDHDSNRALRRNTETRHPVRVIRGSKNPYKWGPNRGYRYDGLYDVISANYVKGKSGYMICRFKLQRRPGQIPLEDLPRT